MQGFLYKLTIIYNQFVNWYEVFPALNLATVSNLTKIYPTIYKNLSSNMKYFLPVSQSAFYTLQSEFCSLQFAFDAKGQFNNFHNGSETVKVPIAT